MNKHALTCEEAARLFESLLDGEIKAADEEALRAHITGCPACRAMYALDLALIKSIHDAPDMVFESLSGEVTGRLRTRARRSWVLRWGFAVTAICVAGAISARFGSGIYEVLLSLFTGSFRTSPTYLALTKVAGLAVDFAGMIRSLVFSGTAPGGLGSYAPQVAVLTLLAGALSIFMMYAMGRWLGKPMEVKS